MIYLLHHVLLAATNIDPSCHAVICHATTGIPGGTADVGGAAGKIMKLVFSVMGTISVIVVMIGGLQYVLSAGDPKRIMRARETILYAVIGVAISLSAYAIVTFISVGLSK